MAQYKRYHYHVQSGLPKRKLICKYSETPEKRQHNRWNTSVFHSEKRIKSFKRQVLYLWSILQDIVSFMIDSDAYYQFYDWLRRFPHVWAFFHFTVAIKDGFRPVHLQASRTAQKEFYNSKKSERQNFWFKCKQHMILQYFIILGRTETEQKQKQAPSHKTHV